MFPSLLNGIPPSSNILCKFSIRKSKTAWTLTSVHAVEIEYGQVLCQTARSKQKPKSGARSPCWHRPWMSALHGRGHVALACEIYSKLYSVARYTKIGTNDWHWQLPCRSKFGPASVYVSDYRPLKLISLPSSISMFEHQKVVATSSVGWYL